MFSGIPQFEPYTGHPGEFVITQPWWYEHPVYGRTDVYEGYVTDWASTPQLLHAFAAFDPLKEGINGALAHDMEYSLQRRPRAECDAILRAALIEGGMGRGLADTYWLGVRSGGWWPWWKRRARGGGGLQPDDFIDSASYMAALAASARRPTAAPAPSQSG